VLPVCFAATPATVQLIDRDGDVVLRLEGHTRGVNALSWAPDGSLLASASWDHTVRLWNGSGECVRVLDGFGDSVESVEFGQDGDLLVASRDRTVRRIVDAAGDAVSRTVATLDCAPSRATASPDGRIIAVATEGDYAAWIDARSGERRDLAHPGTVYGVAWSRDGRLATACEDGAVRVFDGDGREVARSEASAGRAVQVAWHPDGTHLGVGLRTGGAARVFDGAMQPVLEVANGKEVTVLAWTPSGDRLAIGSGRGELSICRVLP
jgi:WD40 repeat protein